MKINVPIHGVPNKGHKRNEAELEASLKNKSNGTNVKVNVSVETSSPEENASRRINRWFDKAYDNSNNEPAPTHYTESESKLFFNRSKDLCGPKEGFVPETFKGCLDFIKNFPNDSNIGYVKELLNMFKKVEKEFNDLGEMFDSSKLTSEDIDKFFTNHQGFPRFIADAFFFNKYPEKKPDFFNKLFESYKKVDNSFVNELENLLKSPSSYENENMVEKIKSLFEHYKEHRAEYDEIEKNLFDNLVNKAKDALTPKEEDPCDCDEDDEIEVDLNDEEDDDNEPDCVSCRFEEITDEMNEIFQAKNHDYGSSFDNTWNEFGMTSLLVRLSDKLNRLKKLNSNGECSLVNDESMEDTLMDLANYAVLGIMNIRNDRDKQSDMED